MGLQCLSGSRRVGGLLVLWVLLVAAALVFSACGGGGEAVGGGPGDPEPGEGEEPGPGPVDEDPPAEEQEPTFVMPAAGPGEALNPLTGQAVPLSELVWRYSLVVFDNNPRARPQSGLPDADLVYEVLVEGGITRFLALYRTGSANPVGPVRSSRHYFLDLAREWDAVLVHAGGSPLYYEQVGGTGLKVLDDIKGAAGGGVFWRAGHRQAPHNLYTSTANLRKKIDDRSWHALAPDVEPFRFVHPDDLSGSDPARELVVHWPGYLREVVTYTYNEEKTHYVRFLGPEAHTDAETGDPLTAATILVQFVPVRPIPGDTEGRLDVTLEGEGRLLVVTGGTVREGHWRKEGRGGHTHYLDEDGTAVALVPGQVWILVVPEGVEVETR